jgi:hypothetical protein
MALATRTLIAALTAFAILGLAATSADATHSRGKCKARGDTIAKNDVGRVYEREQEAEVMWGCSWSRNRPFELEVATSDDITTFESYDNVMLRGRYVAWTFSHEDVSCKADCPPNYDATTEYVRTGDLRTEDTDSVASDLYPGTLRLNTSGSLAWLTLAGSGTYDVHAWDRKGHRVADTGAIRRFRLRGRTLSWLNGDVAKSATLSGAPQGE